MGKALIIESNPSFRQTLEYIFHSRFRSVETRVAEDGKHAMKEIETLLPDLILVNIKLADENGIELTRRIKNRFPHVILILLGSHDLPEYRKAACVSGADYFIRKESSLEDYFALIEEALSCLKNSPGQNS
jgi:DNA-binding NarL/FixJ family response regulator